MKIELNFKRKQSKVKYREFLQIQQITPLKKLLKPLSLLKIQPKNQETLHL